MDQTGDWRTVTLSTDNSPPETSTSSPATGTDFTLGTQISLTGGATDDVAVTRVEVAIYNSALETWDGVAFTPVYTRVDAILTPSSGPLVTWTYSFTPPTTGTISFAAFAEDAVGNNDMTGEWRTINVI